jgi:hypothetical protein
VGPGVLNPYERFDVVEVGSPDEAPGACEQASRRSEEKVAEVAAVVARDVCDAFRHDRAEMTVDVERHGNALVVVIATPNAPRRFDTAMNSAIGMALCRQLPWATHVDVRVVATGPID